jgi:hypothetical protein
LALRLRAGSHTLTATWQGKSLRWEITLSPGRTEEHRFEFAATAAPAPAPTPAAPVASAPVAAASPAPNQDVAQARGGTVRKLGYLVTGAGVLTLGGGHFVGSQAKSQESELREKCSTLPVFGYSCPESSENDFEKAQNKADMANVLIIAGGVVAAGGLAMIIWGGPKPSASPTAASLSLSPVVGAREAGLFASGSF